MEARAQVKYVRISPRKVKIVLDLIRNKPVDVALAIVRNTPKAACEPLEKLLVTYQSRDLAVKEDTGRWRLTPKGFMVSNSIILQLLEVQQQSKPLSRVLR